MKTTTCAAALAALGAVCPALSHAQTLEAAGISIGTPIQLSNFRPSLQASTIAIGANGASSTAYKIKSPTGGGLRLGVYGRWKIGEQNAFVQTEAAYNRLTTFDYEIDTETRNSNGSITTLGVASYV